jgi:hypothetical protein
MDRKSIRYKWRVLKMFLDNMRWDTREHLRDPLGCWEVAEMCVWLEEVGPVALMKVHRKEGEG